MLPNISLLTKVLEMTAENVAAVVITGMVVVFIGLIILILFVQSLGFVFTKLEKRKQKEKGEVENK